MSNKAIPLGLHSVRRDRWLQEQAPDAHKLRRTVAIEEQHDAALMPDHSCPPPC